MTYKIAKEIQRRVDAQDNPGEREKIYGSNEHETGYCGSK